MTPRWRGPAAAVLAGVAAWAAGCATTAPASPPASPPASLPASPPAIAGPTVSGRLSVSVAAENDEPARQMTASFDLQGSAARGQLDLTSPTGSIVARARWSQAAVVLLQSNGTERQYVDLGDMTQSALGVRLPLAALLDWLQGRPWPGAPFIADAPAPVTRFTQLGWFVDLTRFDDALVSARRVAAPEVAVRIKLDRP